MAPDGPPAEVRHTPERGPPTVTDEQPRPEAHHADVTAHRHLDDRRGIASGVSREHRDGRRLDRLNVAPEVGDDTAREQLARNGARDGAARDRNVERDLGVER